MDEPHDPLFSVLLSTARPVDAAALGRVLAPLLGVTPHDAARHARDANGLLLDAVPREQALAAVEALVAAGFGARAAPAEEVPSLGAVEEPVGARVIEEGLEISARVPFTAGGGDRPATERRTVPWADVRLAIACALDAGEAPRREDPSRKRREVGAEPEVRALERDAQTLLAGEDAGLEPEAGRLLSAIGKRRRDERRETSLLVDLVLADGRIVRLRKEALASIALEDAPARSLQPEGFGEGFPLPGHSMSRFLALARIACAAAAARGGPAAPETESLLWSGLLAPALFRVEDDLRRYERWLLAPQAPSPPSTPQPASPPADPEGA